MQRENRYMQMRLEHGRESKSLTTSHSLDSVLHIIQIPISRHPNLSVLNISTLGTTGRFEEFELSLNYANYLDLIKL